MTRASWLTATGLLLLLAAPAVAQDATAPGPPKATPIAEPPTTPSGSGTGVRLTTDKGDIVIGLFDQSSPVAAENFLNLATSGFYAGTTFHRLVPGFVIQGGDPDGDGSGGPGYTIEDEPVVGRYGRGIVAMARKEGVPNSQGSQFFVVLDDEAERALESARTYAILGRVVEGMEVVDAIAAMPNSGEPTNRALEPVTITGATVEQVTLPPDEPSSPAEPVGDPELESQMPAIEGYQIQVDSLTGPELAQEFGDDPAVAALEQAASSVGHTLDDLSIAFATYVDDIGEPAASITAFRVQGADAADLIDPIAPVAIGVTDPVRTEQEVGGKPVIIFSDGPDDGASRAYAYPQGDTLWIVFGPEELVSQILAALP